MNEEGRIEIQRDSTATSPANSADTAQSETKSSEPVSEKKVEHKSLRSALKAAFESPSPKEEKVAPATQAEKAAESSTPKAGFAPVAPPADMRPEEIETFNKLSPELQQYVSRRAYETRSEFKRQTEALREREKSISGLMGEIAPYREQYAKDGISEVDIVRRSLAWDRAFRADPAKAAREYLAAWGVDPQELVGQAQNQQQMTPAIDESTIESIAERKARELFERQNQERSTYAAAEALKSFWAEKPLLKDPGTASQIEAAMAPIVEGLSRNSPGSSPREILETAYNYVTRGNPRFAELQSKLDGAAEAEKARSSAIAAQNASRSVSGGPGVGTPAKKYSSIGEALRAHLRS